MRNAIYLCVMSDDFGMHPAVNEGIAEAFTRGLLTDANLMAPCPAFAEAAAIALQTGLPVGFHATLTCDWDIYRWGPLTHAPSLSTPEGFFKHVVSLAWSEAKDEEVLAELTAQIAALEACGIHSTHSSYHMGYDVDGRLFRILKEIGVKRVGPMRLEHVWQKIGMPAFTWTSTFSSSTWTVNYKQRRSYLKGLLRRLTPGYHLWQVHAGADSPALDEMCSPDYFARSWARAYRAADLSLLIDPEIIDLIAELGIQRVPVSHVPVE